MNLKEVVVTISYILFFISIVITSVEPPFIYKYKLLFALLQTLFFCTGPLVVFIMGIKKKRSKKKTN